MKTILLGLFPVLMFVSYGQEQLNHTVIATFDGYDEGVYYFSNDEDDSYDFEKVETQVLKEFNLNGEDYLDQKFKITYIEETYEDEEGEEMTIWVIIKLELVKD